METSIYIFHHGSYTAKPRNEHETASSKLAVVASKYWLLDIGNALTSYIWYSVTDANVAKARGDELSV